MKEALVGIRKDGEVRAIFCIDSQSDKRESYNVARNWEANGRTVKKCSQEHAHAIVGQQWKEEII